MITGELKTKIDSIWNAMWAGGIANPLTVIEQLTYLLFIKRLDEIPSSPPPSPAPSLESCDPKAVTTIQKKLRGHKTPSLILLPSRASYQIANRNNPLET